MPTVQNKPKPGLLIIQEFQNIVVDEKLNCFYGTIYKSDHKIYQPGNFPNRRHTLLQIGDLFNKWPDDSSPELVNILVLITRQEEHIYIWTISTFSVAASENLPIFLQISKESCLTPYTERDLHPSMQQLELQTRFKGAIRKSLGTTDRKQLGIL